MSTMVKQMLASDQSSAVKVFDKFLSRFKTLIAGGFWSG